MSGQVHHVVLIEPADDASDEAFSRLWAAVASLQRDIPGIVEVSCGASVSPEGLEQGFTQGFVMRFADAAARDVYLPHPAHQAVAPLVRQVAKRVLVFDVPV